MVDLPDHIRAHCGELDDGVLYAVKTLARRLAEDPRLGERAGRLGLVQLGVLAAVGDLVDAAGEPCVDAGAYSSQSVLPTIGSAGCLDHVVGHTTLRLSSEDHPTPVDGFFTVVSGPR
jgi:hypothetical protein